MAQNFSESKLRLSYAIIKHLQSDVDSGSLNPDQTESLEVAVMCLQSVYGLDLQDQACVAKYGSSINLQDVFQQNEQKKDEAEKLKNQGNQALKAENYSEAVDMYTKAITLDPSNATYYSNRAAANIKLKELQQALADCQHAVSLNPSYARAHGRMGFVYSSLNEWIKARNCYKKCIELEPDNAEYKTNLDIAEQRVQHLEQQQQQQPEQQLPPGLGALGGAMPNLAGTDIAGLMSNPAFMNLASTVMQNPSFQKMAVNMLGSQMGSGAAAGAEGESEGPPGAAGVFGMMPRLQDMARQMQENNPSMYQELQQEATRFQQQARQQQQVPADEEAKEEKKEENQ